MRALRHLLRAKAVLCPGLTVKLHDEATGEQDSWYFENGLRDYLKGEMAEHELLPADLFVGSLKKTPKSSTGPRPGCRKASWCRKATST